MEDAGGSWDPLPGDVRGWRWAGNERERWYRAERWVRLGLAAGTAAGPWAGLGSGQRLGRPRWRKKWPEAWLVWLSLTNE